MNVNQSRRLYRLIKADLLTQDRYRLMVSMTWRSSELLMQLQLSLPSLVSQKLVVPLGHDGMYSSKPGCVASNLLSTRDQSPVKRARSMSSGVLGVAQPTKKNNNKIPDDFTLTDPWFNPPKHQRLPFWLCVQLQAACFGSTSQWRYITYFDAICWWWVLP